MMPAYRPLVDRFHDKYIVDPDTGCWLWTAALNNRGYGTLGYGAPTYKAGYAHRISYELHHGPIPTDRVVDHMCDVRRCVNPDHLQLLTNRENILRSDYPPLVAHVLGQCTQGHILEDTGYYVRRVGPAAGTRLCRECMLRRAREYSARKQELRRASA